jgi:hypothetical protein
MFQFQEKLVTGLRDLENPPALIPFMKAYAVM